jgi:hypothetical protein
MTDCETIRRLLGPWLDGELRQSDAERIGRHLQECTLCAEEKRRLERLQVSLKNFFEEKASGLLFEPFWDRLHQRISEKRSWHTQLWDWLSSAFYPRRVAWAIPAGILLLLVILSFEEYLPGWPGSPSKANLTAVDSIDGHGFNVAVFRESRLKPLLSGYIRIKKTRMNHPGNPLRRNLLFSFLLAFCSVDLSAAEKAQKEVQVQVGIILASNESDCLDPKLSRMKSQLEVIKYRCYHLLNEQIQKVPWQSNVVFEIPGGRFLVVMPQEFRNNRLSLKVRLLEGEKPLLDTTVRLRNRGNFLLGGPPHDSGVLIISISGTIQ